MLRPHGRGRLAAADGPEAVGDEIGEQQPTLAARQIRLTPPPVDLDHKLTAELDD
jgi:hypothetical protein